MMKAAVILSGCGFMDGAEIRESVLALTYLSKHKVSVDIYAPDINQHSVVNHQSGETTNETRNVLVESARIARGKTHNLGHLEAHDYDFLVIPGGYGVAKNLSSLAFDGAGCRVNLEFKTAVESFMDAKKPIGAICIAPAVLAVAVGSKCSPLVTIGDDATTADVIRSAGGRHENCATNDIKTDIENLIVSTPAYMREDELWNIAEGIEKLITKCIELAQSKIIKKAS